MKKYGPRVWRERKRRGKDGTFQSDFILLKSDMCVGGVCWQNDVLL